MVTVVEMVVAKEAETVAGRAEAKGWNGRRRRQGDGEEATVAAMAEATGAAKEVEMVAVMGEEMAVVMAVGTVAETEEEMEVAMEVVRAAMGAETAVGLGAVTAAVTAVATAEATEEVREETAVVEAEATALVLVAEAMAAGTAAE